MPITIVAALLLSRAIEVTRLLLKPGLCKPDDVPENTIGVSILYRIKEKWSKDMHRPYGPYEKYFKRLLDIICALLAITVFSWLYLILIILGAIFMRGNPFFTQERPGKDEKIFKLIKFRSMDNRKDKNGVLLPDEIRLNRYGRLLRKTSLDELPEAFNILVGDMSVIGPRPLLVSYLPYYTEEERHRHDVRPGLSGWAQVNGRTICGWDMKLAYDLEYVKQVRFIFDVKIILRSIQVFIKHSDNAVDTTKTEGNFATIRKAMVEQEKDTSGGLLR